MLGNPVAGEKSWLVAAALGLLLGSAGAALTERGGTPSELPFAWEEGSASPGAALALEETERVPARDGGVLLVKYKLKATGFAPDASLAFWVKRDRGYLQFPAKLGADGVVEIKREGDSVSLLTIAVHRRDEGPVLVRNREGRPISLGLAGFAEGIPLSVAVATEDGKVHAQTKALPLPNQAAGEGGCSAAAEIQTPTGLVFLISLKGFQPGEDVQVESRYRKEVMSKVHKASDTGAVSFPVLFGDRDSGKATISAKGGSCSVKLEYKIGRDAFPR
ncbi:MAG TPA: hypothetical protein VHR45_23935 [Thermoanaerobaculia bacterium]|nr:hypothetical protein [Thermoanaerobaculia bacterium]